MLRALMCRIVFQLLQDKIVEIQEPKPGEALETIWPDSHLATVWTLKPSWVALFSFIVFFLVYHRLSSWARFPGTFLAYFCLLFPSPGEGWVVTLR